MGARLQDWFTRNIWSGSSSNGLETINGTILQSLFSGDNFAGETVTVRAGLRITAVYISVNVISNTISSLPFNVIKEDGDKKSSLTDHSAYYPLAHQPNTYMTSANFWHTEMVHVLAWGNGYAKINRDSRQNPVSFDIWEPWCVSITKEDGNLFYHYKGETVNARDILHFRMNSLDGICGLSPIEENQNTMGMAMKLNRYASLILGSQPPGILSYEGNLTPEQMAESRKQWKGGTQGDVRVLSGKWKYEPIITPADETQYTITKENNEREIYGIYQLPPTFAQNFQRATFSNAEQSDLVYAKHTITPLVTMIEKECNMKLFFEREKKNTYVKMNMNGLLRGDIAARQSFYQSMVNTGVMNRNEVRSLEDMNPYESGEDFLVQGAMVPADMLREHYEKQLLPTAEPVNPQPKKNLNGHPVLN